jgi:hypothetical protein
MKKLIVLVLLLVSCNTEKKQLDKFNNYGYSHTPVAAQLCAVLFPAKDTLIQGRTDTLTRRDTLVSIKVFHSRDTVEITRTVTVHDTKVIHKTDTVKIVDKAAFAALQNKWQTEHDNGNTLTEKLQVANTNSDIWKKRFWVAVGIMSIYGVGLIGIKLIKLYLNKL